MDSDELLDPLSDEAFWKWELGSATPLEAWRESARRSDARLAATVAAHATQVIALTKWVEELEQTNKRLRTHVADLQSGMYVNCVYCGHRYGPGETTPVSMADALKAHIEQCREHPMSHLKAEYIRLQELIAKARSWLDQGLTEEARALLEGK